MFKIKVVFKQCAVEKLEVLGAGLQWLSKNLHVRQTQRKKENPLRVIQYESILSDLEIS